MFLSRRFCAALPHATALPNSSLHAPLCEICFARFAVGRISSSPPTPETLLFSRVSCFCQGDFVRRCRTQLRCRTLRCTLRFAKSVSLASLLGESLLLRQHLKPYCLVGFRVSVKEILCGVAARNCVAELFVARSALRKLFRSLRCWANLFFSANQNIGVFRLSIGF